MKVLSLYPEHVEAFRLGLRTVETRSWRTAVRERIALHASLRDPDSAEARRDPISRRAMDALPHGQPLPRGVIVMTFEVVDCAPIGGPFDFRTGVFEGDEGDFPGQHVVVVHPPTMSWDTKPTVILDPPGGAPVDLSDEAPLGDFRPGRWAWVFARPEVLPEPAPFKGGQGLSRTWEP